MRSPSRPLRQFQPIRCLALMCPMTRSTGAATHLAADRGRDAAHLAADPDAELLRVVVAAIAPRLRAFAGAGLCRRGSGGSRCRSAPPARRPPLPGCGHQRGLPCSALACRTNAQTDRLRLGGRGRHRHLAAELVGRAGFAFADALDLGGVQRIVLGAAPGRQASQVGPDLARTRWQSADRESPNRSIDLAGQPHQRMAQIDDLFQRRRNRSF